MQNDPQNTPNAPALKGELVLRFAQMTDAGGRQANQDALASAAQDDLACFVVADGVGGHVGGEIASSIVVEAVLRQFLQEATFSPRALQSYLAYAAEQVALRKSAEPQLRDMSATVALLLLDPKSRMAIWTHMGDTRVYLFRQNKLHSVTKDHSLVQQLVDAGYCSAGQLPSHPQRSVLCAAIGAELDAGVEISSAESSIAAGDTFLICSDGFWEWLSQAEMESALQASDSMQAWLDRMRDKLLKNAGASTSSQDNYTALAIACVEQAPS